VTQTENSATERQSASLAVRFAWIALILATLYLCYFHNLGAIGFVGPDEPRYAWIARDMAETGDWVTPRLYGEPWFEKPPLYYWAAGLSFKLFGVSEAPAHFPSALAALFATLAMAWLAWRLYGAETARWLLLLLPTTVGMIGFSHAAATDMLFAATLTMAMVCAASLVGLVPSSALPAYFISSSSFTSFFFGFFLGLAVLAKGPAGIILSGGGVLLWAIFTKRWRDAFRCLHPIAIASFCLTALPWYILCARRNPDFLRIFIVEHNFKRYLTPEFQHLQPFWFYIPIVLLAVFPWTVLMFPAARQAFSENKNHRPELASMLFFISWPAFVLFFFTASRSKLPGYILPAIPPLTLLLAKSLATSARAGETSRRWLTMPLGASLIAAGFALSMVSGRLPTYTDIRPAPEVTAIALTAGIGGMVIALCALFRRANFALFTMVVFLLLLVAQIDNFIAKLDAVLTARTVAAQATRLWPQYSTNSAATWQLKRSLAYQLNYYSHAEVPEWKQREPKPKWLLVEPRRAREARVLGFTCLEYLVYPAVIPCKDSDLTGGLGALGGSGSSGGSDANRQPR